MQATTPEVSNLTANLGLLTYDSSLDEDDKEVFAMVAVTADVEGTDPTSVKEARLCSDWSKWEEAMCYNCLFSSIYSSFDFPTLFPFTTGRGTHRFCSSITSDTYLHLSVLLRRLRSSSYSSFPSPSFLFYDDASL